MTGFIHFEFPIGAKWLEVLKQIAPNVTRVAVIYDPANPASFGYLPMMEAAARASSVQIYPTAVRNAPEIERAIDSVAREPNGALIPIPGPVMGTEAELIITLANRHRLPNIYAFRGVGSILWCHSLHVQPGPDMLGNDAGGDAVQALQLGGHASLPDPIVLGAVGHVAIRRSQAARNAALGSSWFTANPWYGRGGRLWWIRMVHIHGVSAGCPVSASGRRSAGQRPPESPPSRVLRCERS
jgi:hypothetical protein